MNIERSGEELLLLKDKLEQELEPHRSAYRQITDEIKLKIKKTEGQILNQIVESLEQVLQPGRLIIVDGRNVGVIQNIEILATEAPSIERFRIHFKYFDRNRGEVKTGSNHFGSVNDLAKGRLWNQVQDFICPESIREALLKARQDSICSARRALDHLEHLDELIGIIDEPEERDDR